MNSVMRIILGSLVILLVAGCGAEKNKGDFIDRMEMEHENDAPVANAAAERDPSAEVVTESVQYAEVGGETVTGYLAKPKGAEGNLPGLIVIHEWWGLNDNIRMMARRLADQGYTALAVDLYYGKTAETPDMAGKYARQAGSNPDRAVANLEQAYAYLTEQQNATSVGTIGWCFGGGWSLQAALAMPEKVDATVIYYGRLVTVPEQLEKLDMPILGIFGSEDQGIPPSEVNKFEAALNEAGVSNSIHIYEGANHAFANPSGNRYKKEAAEDAWEKTVAFFKRHLE